ncbi:uncharacterized protein TOT_040000644 [Theileria orientalis strain Shintoku]|uniref:Uncharacterized protein n=1 Tax=Theileria orientalis strain Shintoku TaxID=869250 RepID=J4DAZ8_THEOR|nr:uncharacterized protein TOT_040000644 [Theileria orientalis strain Shintoku]BAM42275.1 uncharacterized protein TOT_040000644 [Theileria orientalis strain Shintoku]|eukprot:XP_009692576.1 uncharacterized protein TOT_040000644 [Theileria orientalis strain Shintoku]
MNRIFNLSLLDKTKNKYPYGNGKSFPSQVESNDQLLSKLQDLIALTPLNNEAFGSFVDILVKRFNWRTAQPEEIDKCKNIVLDLISIDGGSVNGLVRSFISHFRSSDEEHQKVDIGSRIFDSVLLLKKHIRNILTTSADDVELEGEDYELLYELLGNHSSRKVKSNVVAIFPSTHRNPRFNGLRCFFYRNRDGTVDFFSYARCCDNVKTRGQVLREHLCDMLVEIYRLAPSVLGTITETLDSMYPHHNVQIEHHISFTKAILYISRRIECSRSVLYKILINKLTIIDSEIKLADPNVVDVEKVENLRSEKLKELANQLIKGEKGVEESKVKLENPDWFKSMYEKLLTEEDTDDMSQKLDFLMGIMLEELESVLRSNMNVPYTPRSVDTHYTSESEGEELATPVAKHDQSSHHSTESTYSKSNVEDVYATSTTVSSSGIDSSDLKATYKVKLENGVKYKYSPLKEVDEHSKMADVETGYTNATRMDHDYGNVSTLQDGFTNGTKTKDGYGTVTRLQDGYSKVISSQDGYVKLGRTDRCTIDSTAQDSYSCKLGRMDEDYSKVSSIGGYTVADMIVMDLFDTFDQIILPTYNCKYVQFIYFFVLSINHKWARMFIQRLFSIVYSNAQHAIRRRAAASYISSLICRSNYVLPQYVCGSLNHLFGLLSYFDEQTSGSGHSQSLGAKGATLTMKAGSRRGNMHCFSLASAKLSLFYSILQDILYIICYRTDLISASPSLVAFIKDTRRGLLAYLDSYLRPLNYCKHSVITEAIRSTAHFENLKEFHAYLEAAESELASSRRSSEDYRWSLYSPIDSFFPFDPYLLHHSRYYIRDKYRSETTAQQMECTKQNHTTCKLIINELVEAIKNEKELVDKDLEDVTKLVHDSLGFSSISRSIKAKLDSYKRKDGSEYVQIEADYDFWGYEATIEELEQYSQPQQQELQSTEEHIIVGIDQIGDLELSLCDSVLLNDVGERKHGLLDLLTSSRAYKSAARNSKRARDAIV